MLFLPLFIFLLELDIGEGIHKISDGILRSFRSHVVFLDRVVNSYVELEEHYDNNEAKGQLVIQDEFSYQIITYTPDLVLKFEDTDCIQLEPNTDNTFLNYWGQTDRGYLIGPITLVVLAKIYDPNLKWEPTGTKTIRGIPTKVMQARLYDFNHDLNITLYYALATKWKKFSSKHIPIRLTLEGLIENLDGEQYVNRQYDYYSYYENSTWREFEPIRPIYGIGCSNLTTSKTFPANIDEKFQKIHFNIEKIDKKLNMRYHLEAFEDNDYGFLKYTYKDPNIGEAIYDTKLNILYYLKNNNCKIEKKSEVYAMNELIKFNYYYLGEHTVRGVKVDIWERVEFNHSNKLVHTLFLSHDENLNSMTKSHVPIMSLHKKYGEFQRVLEDIEFRYYDFSSLFIEGTYQDFLDINICLRDQKNKTYFKFAIDFKDKSSQDVMIKNEKSIKTEFTWLLSNILKIRPLRIPSLELEFEEDQMIAIALISGPINPFIIFSPSYDDFAIYATDYVKETGEYAVCAQNALNLKSNKFKMCYSYSNFKSFCVVPINQSGPLSVLSQSFCQTFSFQGNLSLSDVFGPSLEDIRNTLTNITLAKNFKFEVNITESNKANTLQLDVRDIKFEMDEAYKNLHLNILKWSWNGYKINNKSNSDILVLDDLQVQTHEDCIHACLKSHSINCLAASYCSNGKGNKCILGGSSFTDDNISSVEPPLVIEAESGEHCNIYKKRFVYKFDAYYEVSAIFPYEKMVEVIDVEHCAEICHFADFGCKSFEICDDKCYLRKEHLVDIHETVVTESLCELYSLNYLNDYIYTGKELVKDTYSLVEAISLTDCAKACSESKRKDCISFNYCGQTALAPTSKCLLSRKSPRNSPTVVDTMCKNYLLRNIKDDTKTEFFSSTTMSGFNLFILLVGMFNLGLILTLVGFVVYYKYNPVARTASGSFSSPILIFTNNEGQEERINRVMVMPTS